MHKHDKAVVKKTSQLPLALRSLPPEVGLCTSTIPGQECGICAKRKIPVGAWIGPYEGKFLKPKELSSTTDTSYMWEVCSRKSGYFSILQKKSLFWDATVQLQIKEVDKMWQAQRVDYLTSSRRVRHLSQQSRRILIAYCINLFLFGVHYPLYQQSLSFVIEKDSAWIFFELALNLASVQFRTQA